MGEKIAQVNINSNFIEEKVAQININSTLIEEKLHK
jgi:hypothetical protein